MILFIENTAGYNNRNDQTSGGDIFHCLHNGSLSSHDIVVRKTIWIPLNYAACTIRHSVNISVAGERLQQVEDDIVINTLVIYFPFVLDI